MKKVEGCSSRIELEQSVVEFRKVKVLFIIKNLH